jgi:phage terminase large subunit-like protein
VQAQRSPGAEPAFLNLRLNRRVSATASLISGTDWKSCGDPVDPAELEGRPCWCGLDTASTKDLAALIAYFPEDGGAVLAWFWTPQDTVLDHEHHDRAPFSAWVREGYLLTTPGRTIDLMAPILKLGEVMDLYDVCGVAHDRHRIAELRRLLDQAGIDAPLVEIGQGFVGMAPAVDAFERAVLDRRLRHGMHPVLTWNVANTRVVTDPSGNRKVDKTATTLRIDGAVALVEACGIHARTPPPIAYDFSLPLVLIA